MALDLGSSYREFESHRADHFVRENIAVRRAPTESHKLPYLSSILNAASMLVLWPYSLSVRMFGFHPEERGSTPRRATILLELVFALLYR